MSKAPEGVFCHPAAIVESERVGSGTRIWAFAHILPGAVIGRDCNVCDHVFIENDVIVGDRVTVKCGVQLWDGVTLEDDVFVGPNATFTNDAYPRSRQYLDRFLRTVVRCGASIGANATVLPGLTIGRGAMIGAGAVVTGDVPANAIIIGNPGAITGYVSGSQRPAIPVPDQARAGAEEELCVRGAKLLTLRRVHDLRGGLVVAELARLIPFQVRRFFTVFDVPSRDVRGEHAHRRLWQFLICVKGECSLLLDDGTNRVDLRLDSPTKGALMPPLTWGTQYKFSRDAVLLVFASEEYDASEYIRDYEEFRGIVAGRMGLSPAP